MLFGKFSMMFLVILYLKNCVCYPVVKTSSSSRTVQNIERTKSGLEFLPTKSTKKRVILTYEDLPEDGSRDEEFEMLQNLHQNCKFCFVENFMKRQKFNKILLTFPIDIE